MTTCGIDLKGNDAILVCLRGSADDFVQLRPSVKKFRLKDSRVQGDIKKLFRELMGFFQDCAVDHIAIKERATRGKFAGGPTSFKMEALIQNAEPPVEILNSRTVQARLKTVDLDLEGLNQYQVEAFKLAYYLLLEKGPASGLG